VSKPAITECKRLSKRANSLAKKKKPARRKAE
jgi:hypothetical protein